MNWLSSSSQEETKIIQDNAYEKIPKNLNKAETNKLINWIKKLSYSSLDSEIDSVLDLELKEKQ